MSTARLRYRPPYDWEAMLRHLAARAIEGVERVDGGAYERTIRHENRIGTVRVTHRAAEGCLVAAIRIPDARRTPPALVARLRRLFDVDADVTAIGAHLARDPMLAPLVKARPGLRTPGAFDGFELAVRAVLGQQISVERARVLAGHFVRLTGPALPDGAFVFPTASEVLAADLGPLGMPRARKEALRAIAAAAVMEPDVFEAKDDALETKVARLRAIRGVGEWTAQYIALRACREPDAFPSTDVALLRSASLGIAALEARAERWRPWRAYAAQHLWTTHAYRDQRGSETEPRMREGGKPP